MQPAPTAGIKVFSQNETVLADNCNGTWIDRTISASGWNSSNTGIATVSGPTVTGVGGGSTTIGSFINLETFAAGNPRCVVKQFAPTNTINVSLPCPSSSAILSTTQESLLKVFPANKTGLGATVAIQVRPASINWNGTLITETLSKSTPYTCPSSWNNGNLCTGSSTFTIGEGPVQTVDGQILQAQQNVFYDEHTTQSDVSLLDYSGIQSCTATCKQNYSCQAVNIGNYTVTYTFTKGTISGTPVTNVSATVK